MAELPFVGVDRRRIVTELVDAFRSTCSEDQPRLVTLEAASGSGKTRMMRELYRVLAREHQAGARFWPLELDGGSAPDEDVDSRRKHISPGLVAAPADAKPAWFWWGVSVKGQQYVRPLQALMEDRRQLTTFADVLQRTVPRTDPAHRLAREYIGREWLLKGLGSAVAGETITTLTASSGYALPGATIVQWIVQKSRAMGRDRRRAAQAAAMQTASLPNADHLDRFVEELSGRIPALSKHVPFILAIEDLHRADPALVELLLATLRAERGRVLVIGTAWPGTLDDPERAVSHLLRDVDERRVTRYRPDEIPALPLEDRVLLARVRVEEQRALLAQRWSDAPAQEPPAVADATCVALAERYRTTPLALEQVCGLPVVRSLIARGRLDVDAVATLPENDPAAIYASMWEALPEELRLALEVCALTTPAAQSPALSSTVWDVELAIGAGRRAGLIDVRVGPDVLRRHLHYGWAVPLSDRLWACTEPPQFTVAIARARDEIAEVLAEDLRAALIVELATEARRPGPGGAVPAEFHDAITLGLALADELPWDDVALGPLGAADRLLSRASALEEVTLLVEARTVGEAALRHTPVEEAGWVPRAVSVAEMTGRSGSASAAAALLDEVTRTIGTLPPPEPAAAGAPAGPDALDIELRRAFWLGEAGRLEAAMTALEQLIARCEARDPRPPQLMEAHVALAAWLGDEARPHEAIALLETVLEDLVAQRSTFSDVVAVHQQLAYWYGEAGATDAAIERLERLERVLRQAPPPGWLVLQSVRQQRGHWLGMRGDAAAAERLLADLEAERRERLGARHPDTLSTRNQRWSWAARRGAVHEGVAEYRRAARDRMDVLGSDAPPAHGTRNNLGIMLVEAGLHDEAAVLLEDVARRMSDLFTPGHRSAILARANVANLTGIRGDAAAALAGVRRAHADWLAHRLPRTRDELALRGNVGVWLEATEEPADALALLEATLSDQVQVLGPDDPDTLITAANVAFLIDRERGGDPARTREAISSLTRVLGPAAPETMTAEHNLGHLLLAGGDAAAARAVLAAVLTRRTDLLGAEHPDTCATERELARAGSVRPA